MLTLTPVPHDAPGGNRTRVTDLASRRTSTVDVADLVAVGIARPEVVLKGRRREVGQLLDDATPGQVKAIAACAKAIVALKDDPELAGTGAGARARR